MNFGLDARPVVVAIAGPNGAGKTTFFRAHLEEAGLRFVNSDVLTRELDIDPYLGAKLADSLRRQLIAQRESFVFETVFSDPVEDKISFLIDAKNAGYNVILCFIGISGPQVSEQRVAMRVSQGGHDVPSEKLESRFARTLKNLGISIRKLPRVFIFDNDDLRKPFRLVATFENGKIVNLKKPVPAWLLNYTEPH